MQALLSPGGFALIRLLSDLRVWEQLLHQEMYTSCLLSRPRLRGIYIECSSTRDSEGAAVLKEIAGRIPQSFEPLLKLAEIGGISGQRAREIYAEVDAAVLEWPTIASGVGIPSAVIEIWQRDILGQTRALRADAQRKPTPRSGRRGK